MAFFTRTSNPPEYSDPSKYKPYLRRDFRCQCAYCEVSEGFVGRREEHFEVDHFRPARLFPQFNYDYANLYYCCRGCNSKKGASWPSDAESRRGAGFADPCLEDPYKMHLAEQENGTVLPLTPVGEYTLDHVRLNREAIEES